jgi:N4-(beta-N-acetylglucosaminyl)-L-asparaginase
MNKLRFIDMIYYILRKDGAYVVVGLWEGSAEGHPHQFTVHDGTARLEVATPLLKGYGQSWPPFPTIPEELKKDSYYLK